MFALPAAASSADSASSSSIQIFGTLYLEYSRSSSRGQAGSASGAPVGDIVSVALLQMHDSEIGIKGEETLCGAYAA